MAETDVTSLTQRLNQALSSHRQRFWCTSTVCHRLNCGHFIKTTIPQSCTWNCALPLHFPSAHRFSCMRCITLEVERKYNSIKADILHENDWMSPEGVEDFARHVLFLDIQMQHEAEQRVRREGLVSEPVDILSETDEAMALVSILNLEEKRDEQRKKRTVRRVSQDSPESKRKRTAEENIVQNGLGSHFSYKPRRIRDVPGYKSSRTTSASESVAKSELSYAAWTPVEAAANPVELPSNDSRGEVQNIRLKSGTGLPATPATPRASFDEFSAVTPVSHKRSIAKLERGVETLEITSTPVGKSSDTALNIPQTPAAPKFTRRSLPRRMQSKHGERGSYIEQFSAGFSFC